MAKLSMAQRKALPKSKFLVPSRAPGPGSYPVPDKAHARAAVGLAAMHHGKAAGQAKKRQIKAKGMSLGSLGQRQK